MNRKRKDKNFDEHHHHHGHGHHGHGHQDHESHAADGHDCDHGIEGVHLEGAHLHAASGRILVAVGLNLLFTIIEFIGAYHFDSAAVLADAVHDAGDVLALSFAAGLQYLAVKPATNRFSFGFRRLSLTSSLLNSLILIIGSSLVAVESISRLSHPHNPVPEGMLALSVFGMVINGYAVYKMSHGKTLNEQVLVTHLLEDVVGWGMVLFVSIVMLIFEVPILDPLLSIGLSIFIAVRAVQSLRKAMRLFLEGVPDGVELADLESEIVSIPRVQEVHDLHTWSLDGQYHLLACHLVVDDETTLAECGDIKRHTRGLLRSHGIAHATIEIESATESAFCDFREPHRIMP